MNKIYLKFIKNLFISKFENKILIIFFILIFFDLQKNL